ncbi:cytochrome c oxidase subunit 6B [Limtongia smithiae]|uniref:cytochrome c oxidase subunit 6B n=1 Tax=Limtongia smithiae TaxID=1125753 RepID=UPI0034CF7F28
MPSIQEYDDDVPVIETPADIEPLKADFPEALQYRIGRTNFSTIETRLPASPTRYDPRFPNQNQTAHCWQNYVDYYKCVAAKGEEFKPCAQFRNGYRLLCPLSWVEKWDEQRENGNFAGDLSP